MKKKIKIADILYIIKSEYLSLIHLIDGDILQTITPIYELQEMLGDDCIEVKKGCILQDMERLRFMKNENWFGMAAARKAGM